MKKFLNLVHHTKVIASLDKGTRAKDGQATKVRMILYILTCVEFNESLDFTFSFAYPIYDYFRYFFIEILKKNLCFNGRIILQKSEGSKVQNQLKVFY